MKRTIEGDGKGPVSRVHLPLVFVLPVTPPPRPAPPCGTLFGLYYFSPFSGCFVGVTGSLQVITAKVLRILPQKGVHNEGHITMTLASSPHPL
jgi:hypothetical protein